MARTGAGRLRLGIIGLGRAWESRQRPALHALGDRIEVAAVHDQVARRAELVARQVGARATEGIAELVHNPEVDAVALLAPQWFGTYPIELAARAAKPIYTAVPLPDDDEGLARMEALGREHPPTLVVEFAPRFDPATIHLGDRLRAEPAPIRRVELTARGPVTDPGQSFLDLIRHLTGSEVAGPVESSREDDGAVAWRWGSGAIRVGMTLGREAAPGEPAAPPFVLAVGLDDGREILLRWPEVGVEPATPRRIGAVAVPEPGPPLAEFLLDQFARLARGKPHAAPTWDDALAAARGAALLRRSARLSRGAARPEPIGGPAGSSA